MRWNEGGEFSVEMFTAVEQFGEVADCPIVSVLTLEADATADDPGADMIEFMTRAVAKIAAG